jgi:hypothetical protein
MRWYDFDILLSNIFNVLCEKQYFGQIIGILTTTIHYPCSWVIRVHLLEQFEDTKVVIRNCKWTDRQSRQTDRQTDHTDRLTDRQTDRSYRTKRPTMVDKILHRNMSTINTIWFVVVTYLDNHEDVVGIPNTILTPSVHTDLC